jgi:hypothetical protein
LGPASVRRFGARCKEVIARQRVGSGSFLHPEQAQAGTPWAPVYGGQAPGEAPVTLLWRVVL